MTKRSQKEESTTPLLEELFCSPSQGCVNTQWSSQNIKDNQLRPGSLLVWSFKNDNAIMSQKKALKSLHFLMNMLPALQTPVLILVSGIREIFQPLEKLSLGRRLNHNLHFCLFQHIMTRLWHFFANQTFLKCCKSVSQAWQETTHSGRGLSLTL